MNAIIYIHGKGGSALECEHYKPLFSDCEVIGLDYQTFSPWETGKEIRIAVEELKNRYENVILIANSIGAFFSMNAGIDEMIQKAYFISPIVNMEKLITDMMKWANVTEQELESKGVIHTDFGEDLSWEYLNYVRSHPIEWRVPTQILYGSNDHLMSIDTITDFANKHQATLTVMEGGEHWFHTGEQMVFLDNWIEKKMETERILLRPWLESDAETLYKYASDPEVGPRAGWPPHKSVEESLEIIRNVFSAEGMWAVIWKESGEPMEQREQSDAGINYAESRQRSTEGQPIGCVGYLPASASNLKIAEDQAEVGYWIARPFWGKGICTEALQLVIDYCFNEKGFTVLWGDFFPSNPASGRVMEKCGFVDTGEETLCPNLEVGSDRPVRVMKLLRPRFFGN